MERACPIALVSVVSGIGLAAASNTAPGRGAGSVPSGFRHWTTVAPPDGLLVERPLAASIVKCFLPTSSSWSTSLLDLGAGRARRLGARPVLAIALVQDSHAFQAAAWGSSSHLRRFRDLPRGPARSPQPAGAASNAGSKIGDRPQHSCGHRLRVHPATRAHDPRKRASRRVPDRITTARILCNRAAVPARVRDARLALRLAVTLAERSLGDLAGSARSTRSSRPRGLSRPCSLCRCRSAVGALGGTLLYERSNGPTGGSPFAGRGGPHRRRRDPARPCARSQRVGRANTAVFPALHAPKRR